MISVKEVTTHTIVIKKSEFVCHLIPCSDIEQAKSLIAQYSDLEATHNCVAYIIGSHEPVSYTHLQAALISNFNSLTL